VVEGAPDQTLDVVDIVEGDFVGKNPDFALSSGQRGFTASRPRTALERLARQTP
jgi:hypothetical protein